MKRAGGWIVAAILALTAAQLAAAPDKNGLESRALYTVTVEVNGKKLALTHIVPEGTPKELIGTNATKARVELLPLKEGDPAQQWRFYPAEVKPEPSYKIFNRLSSNDKTPNATLMVVNVNGEFSADGDDNFHATNNRMSIGLHQDANDRVWLVVKQPNGKFILQSFLGVKEKLQPKGNSHGWGEERVVEAYATKSGVQLRQRPRSKDAGQEWTLTRVGFL